MYKSTFINVQLRQLNVSNKIYANYGNVIATVMSKNKLYI